MAARYSDNTLVCCVENTIDDHIMDSCASFHATYCEEELGRFKLRSGKTLKDVRYIPNLKRRLISVRHLDEEGYHVGFRDQQWKGTKSCLVVAHGNKHKSLYMVERLGDMSKIGMSMLASKGNVSDVQNVDIYFCKPGGLGKQKNLSFIMSVKTRKLQRSCGRYNANLQFGVAKRLSRTFRAKSMGIRAEAPKMLWEDSVSTTYLIYHIPYVSIGLRIPKEEWRGKDTNLAHLKLSETKSHQVIRSRDITFVDSIYIARSVINSSSLMKPIQKSQVVLVDIPENLTENDNIVAEDGLSLEITQSLENGEKESYSEALSSKESVQWKKTIIEEMVLLEKNQACSLVRISAGKKALQRLWMFKVKEEQDGSKRHKARLVVKGFQQKWGDVHQVGDERKVQVLRSFNWPPSELITDDGVLPERGAIYRTKVCTETCASAIYPIKVLVASRDKETNMAARYSDDALVCCVENTVDDHIMDSCASFHDTYCEKELERFKLRSGKTLKDVRYIPNLKRRLISVRQLDEEGYHVGFRDQQWKGTKSCLVVAHGNKHKSLYMVEVYPEGIGTIIDGSGNAAVWFGEAKESFLHNVSKDKETTEFGVAKRLSRAFRAKSMGIRAEAPKMLWEDSVSTTYLIYRILYVPIGLHIPKKEWRGKDTSLAHLKVFGCDSFVKVKVVCGEAMKCTFIGSGSYEMRYSFRKRKVTSLMKPIQKSQVVLVYIPENLTENDTIVAKDGLSLEITQSPGGSSDTSEGFENNGSFEDSGRSNEEYSKGGASSKEGGSETPELESFSEALSSKEFVQWKKTIIEEMVLLKKNQVCSLVRISAGKKALQRLWMFKVKEKQDGSKRHKARLVVKGFKQKWGVDYNEIFSSVVKMTTIRYTKSLIHLAKNLKVCSWDYLVQILISEGSLSLLKILGTKSLVAMFTSWRDRAVWHEPEQFSSELNNISLVDPVDCHDYPSRGYHVISCVDLYSAITF
nr:retrovirus-related Pol polyprotein from transposon TNT 1-94 [Tanacetum cinerariifolium]